jgi:hypothetical protein
VYVTALLAALSVTAPASAQRAAPTVDVRSSRPAPVPRERLRAAEDLRDSLGPESVVDLDRQTGTPRSVARLDGFLTRPSPAPARDIVLRYLRSHADLFGLGAAEIDRLELVRRYRSRGKVDRLMFQQTIDGVPVMDGGISANVTTDGRLVNVAGAPWANLDIGSTTPRLGREDALDEAKSSMGARSGSAPGRGKPPTFRDGRQASLVVFPDRRRPRLAWRTLAYDEAGRLYDTTIDADSGDVLRRHSLTSHAVDAKVFDNYPGAPAGGNQRTADISPYITTPGAALVDGPYATVWSDVDDDDEPQAPEEIAPSSGDDYLYDYTAFPSVSGGFCRPPSYFCSWDHNTAFSWETNREQSAIQAFYYANHFRDHVTASPIEFTPAKGAFKVVINTQDGADTDSGLPDDDHVNNAFMNTPPTGSPLLAAFLFRPDDRNPPVSQQTPTLNSADDARIMYHEYTHGLSNRLIADPHGIGAMVGHQAVSIGEATSDWYAFDILVKENFEDDTAADGEIYWGEYLDNGIFDGRSQPVDCTPDSDPGDCPGSDTAGPAGYTYGDMGKVIDRPESHADGEIWSQSVWDLRRELIAEYGEADGTELTELLVTAGMELSPTDPSFLDMRNAILSADIVYNNGDDLDLIWSVFAERGMGFFASTIDASDIRVVEDFSTPPPDDAPLGDIAGTVTSEAGSPIPGARVYVGGLVGYSQTSTNAEGKYRITDMPEGTYPRVVAIAPGGLDRGVLEDVPVAENVTTTRNFRLRRNWADIGGGAQVAAVDGENSTVGSSCGPQEAIDGHFGTNWRTSSPAFSGDPGPEFLTVRLPEAVDPSAFEIDPTSTCNAGITASLGQFAIEVSSNGTSFRQVASGTFDRADTYRRNRVLPSGTPTAVRFVRLRALATQNSNPPFAGARNLAITEFQIYGAIHRPPTCRGSAPTVPGTIGTPGNDVLVGTPGNDSLDGRGGHDRICGGAGADTIVGGTGRDSMFGEAGTDFVRARDSERDSVNCGPDRDAALVDSGDTHTECEAAYVEAVPPPPPPPPPPPFSCIFDPSFGSLRTTLRRGGAVAFTCTERAAVSMRLTMSRRSAFRAGLVRRRRGGAVTVARGTGRGGSARVRVRFTRKAKRRLSRARRVTLTLRMTARGIDSGLAQRASMRVVLRRR